jgi:hypothetical protein
MDNPFALVLVENVHFQQLEQYASDHNLDVMTIDMFFMSGFGFFDIQEVNQTITYLQLQGIDCIVYCLLGD